MEKEDEENYNKNHFCWICENEIIKIKDKVKDHCHFTGKFRGPAHKSINLKLKIKPNVTKVPVVIHNLKGYDSHLILKKLQNTTENISRIADNNDLNHLVLDY